MCDCRVSVRVLEIQDLTTGEASDRGGRDQVKKDTFGCRLNDHKKKKNKPGCATEDTHNPGEEAHR
jgi:hypothetical protein